VNPIKALLPGHAADLDGLIRAADNATYRAKLTATSGPDARNIEIAPVGRQP
jgi:hypothetical protein